MDFDDAALPVIHLRMQPLLAVHPQARADKWRAALDEAGFLVEIGETNGEEDPREWIRELQSQLDELAALDRKRGGLQGGLDGLRWEDVPVGAWLFALVEPAVALAVARHTALLDERGLIATMLVYVLPAILVVGLLLFGFLRVQGRRTGRLEELVALNHDRVKLLHSLRQNIQRILRDSFVARLGGQVLLCTGDLDWLRRQSRAARRKGAAALAGRLDAEAERVEAAIKAALYVPPRNWSQTGLTTNREAWQPMLAGVGLAA